MMLSTSSGCGRARRATKRKEQQHITPFANDPTRLPPLQFSSNLSSSLPNKEHLSTALIDILLHYSFHFPDQRRFTMPPDLLVGSSNTMEILTLMTDTTKYPPSSKEIMEPLQQNHSAYGSNAYRFLAPTCMGGDAHFFTVDILFDINSDRVFQYVRVYDSLLQPPAITTTNEESQTLSKTQSHMAGQQLLFQQQNQTMKVDKVSSAGQFLCCLQTFLLRFCFVDKEGSEQYRLLQSNPDYIVQQATYEPCPRQHNTWDCGLFSLAVLLHLAHNVSITSDVFQQEHISLLRSALHHEFSVNTSRTGNRTARCGRFLNPQFIYPFFPNLSSSSPTTPFSYPRLFGACALSTTDEEPEKKKAT